MKRYERKILNSSIKVVICSRDHQYAFSLSSSKKAVYFADYARIKNKMNPEYNPTSSKRRRVCFVGNMLAAHNCASVDYMIKAGIVDPFLESNIEFVVAGRMTC